MFKGVFYNGNGGNGGNSTDVTGSISAHPRIPQTETTRKGKGNGPTSGEMKFWLLFSFHLHFAKISSGENWFNGTLSDCCVLCCQIIQSIGHLFTCFSRVADVFCDSFVDEWDLHFSINDYQCPSHINSLFPFLHQQTWERVLTCQNDHFDLSWMTMNSSSVSANKLAVTIKDKVLCCISQSQFLVYSFSIYLRPCWY